MRSKALLCQMYQSNFFYKCHTVDSVEWPYLWEVLCHIGLVLAALQIFNTVGAFSGIRIIWSKSILYPIDRDACRTAGPSPLRWVDEFYLWVLVTKHASSYFDKKPFPLAFNPKDTRFFLG